MTDNVIFLAYANPNVEAQQTRTMMGCAICQNKTFRVVSEDAAAPIMECACCSAVIGRFGWMPDG